MYGDEFEVCSRINTSLQGRVHEKQLKYILQ